MADSGIGEHLATALAAIGAVAAPVTAYLRKQSRAIDSAGKVVEVALSNLEKRIGASDKRLLELSRSVDRILADVQELRGKLQDARDQCDESHQSARAAMEEARRAVGVASEALPRAEFERFVSANTKQWNEAQLMLGRIEGTLAGLRDQIRDTR